MKIHELKTDSNVFREVYIGRKNFEIRKNDRNFKEGDILHFKETVHTGEEMKNGSPLVYGRELLAMVKYILHGPVYGLMDGWCIMSINIIDVNLKD